ncbi:unnamed protein product [Nesidiocoris tenuis]|uniref:MYND-type domain-containing protein n=1 Tax=Nesidiocoris tenuis TaxID=355587 RepID=A0A6H5FXZ4_9HEMI|nr:unnamed protein product [Nesidiocoris tenuis]
MNTVVIVQSINFHRFAVASKTLEAGDAFLVESPYVIGPKADSEFICLGCYKLLENPLALCKICGWPICSDECTQKPWHKENECKVFSAVRMKYKIEHVPGPQLQSITPLRFLMTIDRNRKRWATEVCSMEDHNLERRLNEAEWEREKTNVVFFLRERCRLSDRFTKDLIETVCGILEVNAYEVHVPGGPNLIRALYPKAAILSHSCVANTIHSISPHDLSLVLRTTVYVTQSDELYRNFTNCLLPTPLRRESLRKTHYFDCTCDRCEDPSELESHMNSLNCINCDSGALVPIEPLQDFNTTWKCYFCGKKIKGNDVEQLYEKVRLEIAEMERIESADEKLKEAEKLMKAYRLILHPNHAFNISLYLTLSQLYGRAKGYSLIDLPDVQLDRKIFCCQKVLETLSIVGPGYTRIRGTNSVKQWGV